MSAVETLALAILKSLLELVPALVPIVERGLEGDDSPLANQVRAILPEEGASAAARRELERRAQGG